MSGELRTQSRAAARASAHAKEKDKNIVKILSFDWEPDHPPELRNSFVDADGQLWEVWTVPEGFLGFLNSTEEIANQAQMGPGSVSGWSATRK